MCHASHLGRLGRACVALAAAAVALAAAPASAAFNVGTGTDPANPPPVCPATALPSTPVIIDAFTMDATPADTVTVFNVMLSPAGASLLLSQVDITADDGVTVIASVVPAGDYLTLMPRSPVPVSALTQYKIRISPKTHGQMPAAPGSAIGIRGYLRYANGRNPTKTLTDVPSTTATLDNGAPAEVEWTGVVPNRLPGAPTARVQLSWSATQNVVVLRRMGAPVTESLTDGTTYAVGAPTFGSTATSTQIVAVGSMATLDDQTGLTNTKAYYYKVFVKDPCGNYSVGSSIGPVVPGSTSEGALSGYGPVVGLLNPEPGPVTVPFRVQARVFSPKSAGGAAQPVENNVFLVVSDGTTSAEVQLVRNPNYGGDAESGIFEVGPLGAGNVSPGLTPGDLPGFTGNVGRYTVQVKASNDGRATYVYSAIVGVSASTVRGDGNLLVRDNSSQLCSDCHTLQTHSSEATGTGKGSWYVGCRGCHTPHGTTNASLVKEIVLPPGVNGQQPPSKVVFSRRDGYFAGDVAALPGSASFANAGVGAERRTGICQSCHTRTTHYRFDGTDTSPGGTHYTSNCMTCHPHSQGMKLAAGTCTTCHGDGGASRVAPPKDTCGNLNPTGGTGVNRVGAHDGHRTGGTFTPVTVGCTQCHPAEVPSRPGHPGTNCSSAVADRAAIAWGPLATKNGTLSPQYDHATQSCSATYCHGEFAGSGKQGVASQVTWGGTVACGSCHGMPPLEPEGVHSTADTACADCHPAGYSQGAIVSGSAAWNAHVNGAVDVSGTGCSVCHGDKDRTLVGGTSPLETTDDRFMSAPPRNPTSASNYPYPATSVHLSHVYNTTMSQPALCSDCHNGFVPTGGHKDAITDLGWSARARGPSPTVNYTFSPSFTCQASYCHGDTFAANVKGALTQPVWNDTTDTYRSCDACHKQAPTTAVHTTLTSRAGGSNSATTTCDNCHPATVNASGAVILTNANHVNQTVEYTVGCTSCHASPPLAAGTVDAPGLANAGNANGVGAHGSHSVLGSMTTRSAPYACSACHPAVSGNLHADAAVQMQGSVSWSAGSATCGSNWCHGSTAAQAAWGGLRTIPAWNDGTDNFRACNACHGTASGAAPSLATGHHPGNATCTDCHPNGSSNVAMVTPASNTHVDFKVDTTRTGCTACHGDFGVNNVGATGTGADRAAAPGYNATSRDSLGNVLASAPAVGAHGKHLTSATLKSSNGGFAAVCTDCHLGNVPAAGNITHATGAGTGGARSNVAFSNVALTGLASGGTPLSAAYQNSTTGSAVPGVAGQCSNTYCHGAGFAGTGAAGTAMTPSWTGAAMNCGSCHASPPVDSNHATVVPSGKSCQTCHEGTYSCTVTVVGTYTGCTVDATRHIDGQINPLVSTCTSCHGQPPVQALGNTADPAFGTTGYGAHDPHVNASTFRTAKLACADCHGTLPTLDTHSNGTVEVGWSALATTGTTVSPANNTAFTKAWATTASCTVYCHSPGTAATMGGTRRNPVWTGGAAEVSGCNKCHGAPPPVDDLAADHPQNTTCADCHGAGYALAGITGTAKNNHINMSTVEGRDRPRNGCTACHGVLAGAAGSAVTNNLDLQAAPGYAGSVTVGRDSSGNNTVATPAVGAHDAHLRPSTGLNAIAPVTCATCHGTPPASLDTSHANSAIAVSWAQMLSSTGITVTPVPVSGAFPSSFETTPNCTNYCHSNASPMGGARTTPVVSWTSSTNMTCTSCHAITAPNPASATSPLLSHGHFAHIATVVGGGYFYNCSRCHSNVATGQSDGTGLAITNASNHVTGLHNVSFDSFNGTSASYSAGGTTCANTYCHSNGTNPSGAANTSVAWNGGATSCVSCHGGSLADAVVVGSATQLGGSVTHLAHVRNSGVLGANYLCGDCHAATVAAGTNGPVTNAGNHVDKNRQLSMPARGPFASTTTCGTSYCHSSGQATPVYVSTVSWTGAAIGCNGCHGRSGDSGAPDYTTGNSHGAHVTGVTQADRQATCRNCHAGFVLDPGTAISGARHTDGIRDVAFLNSFDANGATSNYSLATKTCNSISCHGAGSPVWGGPAMDCSGCHLKGTGYAVNDGIDDYTYGNGTLAMIDAENWNSTGHGRMASLLAYAESGNVNPGFDALGTVSTDDGCKYCHDKSVGHDTANNPFRLANVGATPTTATQKNGVCTVCHGGGGYLGKTSANAIDATHFGTGHTGFGTFGGQLCWDCHNPHGDRNYTTNTWLAYQIREQPVRTHADANTSASGWGLPYTRALPVAEFRRGTGFNTTGWDLRDYVNTLTSTAGTFRGVCQVCHTDPTNVTYSQTKYKSHNAGGLCTTCHMHDQFPTSAFKGNGDCNVCHATEQDAPIAGVGKRRNVVAEFSATWSHKRSGGRTVTKYDCIPCHMEATPVTGDASSFHENGKVELRDPDTGNQLTVKTFTTPSVQNPGVWVDSATTVSFTRWSRNMSATLDADPAGTVIRSVMMNQCLKCHDSNGAASTNAQVPNVGATAAKPFGTTIANSAAYTGGYTAGGTVGGVTNVDASFAVTNSSYHPIKGRQNNWYARTTRMVVPWNSAPRTTAVSTTSYGILMSCWDCHALPTDRGTTTGTVTAHGAAQTLRGNSAVAGTPTSTNQTGLCKLCHARYNLCGSATGTSACSTNQSHGAGSAWNSNAGRNEKVPYLEYGCNICHASSYSIQASRPVRAENAHGVNAVITTGVTAPTGRWAGSTTSGNAVTCTNLSTGAACTAAALDRRPYSFVRNTNNLRSHTPLRIGVLSFSSAECAGGTSPCSNGMDIYTPGGTY